MKKTVSVIMLLLAVFASESRAQSFADRLHLEATVGSGYKSSIYNRLLLNIL